MAAVVAVGLDADVAALVLSPPVWVAPLADPVVGVGLLELPPEQAASARPKIMTGPMINVLFILLLTGKMLRISDRSSIVRRPTEIRKKRYHHNLVGSTPPHSTVEVPKKTILTTIPIPPVRSNSESASRC